MNNLVLQPFDYDTSLGTFVCPNLSSVVKFIGYLNNKASFYKGNYMFYMDFEKTYLRSFDGSYIDYYCNIVCSNLDGTGKKALMKNRRVKGQIEQITSSYFTYRDSQDWTKIKKVKW